MRFSDEDTDIKSVVQSWLNKQPEEDRMRISGWIEDHFYKALDYVLKMVSNAALLMRTPSISPPLLRNQKSNKELLMLVVNIDLKIDALSFDVPTNWFDLAQIYYAKLIY